MFTLIAALTAAGAVATIGYLYDAGNDAGFEGFGALLFAGIFALLGLVLVLPASIIATVRKEPGYVVSWVAFIVCLLGFLAVT